MPQYLAQRAAELILQGNNRQAVKLLKEAIDRIRAPFQRLPTWVKPGALVQWIGEGEHDVYKVATVSPGKGWMFTASSVKNDQHQIAFHQERGKRYWRKYRGHLP